MGRTLCRGAQLTVNLKQLAAFVWVADLGSFRRAADRLNTTQPNISARIAGLERALGVSLMDRDAGAVRLTAKGRELLAHARTILRDTDAMIAAAVPAAGFTGTLRLGVTEMIVHTILRPLLATLRDHYPDLTVELTVDLSANLERDLADRTIDLALQNGPFARLMSGTIPLGDYAMIWAGAPSLGLHHGPALTPSQLTAQPILTHARTTRLYQQVAAHIAQQPGLTPRFVPSSNLAACVYLAATGMGLATLPAAMIARELQAGELVEVPYHWQPAPLEFFARYDAERAPAFVAQIASLATQIAADNKNS